ncbi:MAG: hypothetical protein O3C10_09510 [Chloroflexi bacterium]|nr:hypothetical protein [Chloroflexota bacterium]
MASPDPSAFRPALWHNGGNRYASTQEHRMSLDQAPPLKALDAPITFTVWYDYI